MPIRVPLAIVVTGLLAGGCSTIVNNHRQKIDLMSAWMSGNVATAQSLLNDKMDSTKDTGDELAWKLESGTIAFATGGHSDAIREFRTCEDLVKEYDVDSDGYTLLVEKRPSLTPLNVNMTCKDLKDW